MPDFVTNSVYFVINYFEFKVYLFVLNIDPSSCLPILVLFQNLLTQIYIQCFINCTFWVCWRVDLSDFIVLLVFYGDDLFIISYLYLVDVVLVDAVVVVDTDFLLFLFIDFYVLFI